MKLLRKVFFILAYLMPAVLFFSYYPLISLGNDATMNFELSLPLIWLVIFDLTAFIVLLDYQRKQKILAKKSQKGPWGLELSGISDKRFFLFSLFPFYATISAFWSPNPIRAILTAGVLWLTFFAVFALLFVFPLLKPNPNWRQYFLKSLFLSTALVCVFCWVQCVLDLAGLSRSDTLLCAGCTFWTFGFPHPSGFAIEPQFMGNLLLAPTLLVLFLLAFPNTLNRQVENEVDTERKKVNTEQARVSFSRGSGVTTRKSAKALQRQALWTRPEKKQTIVCFALALLFSATLFLTLSRGAIYAYAIALLVLFIFALVRHTKWHYIIIIPIITFCLTLAAQGTFSALSPTNDTFYSGVAKVVHQLSLGIIDIRPQGITSSVGPDAPNENPTNNSTVSGSPDDNPGESSDDNEAIFDGYIPASTNVRLGLNDLALRTWLHAPGHPELWMGTNCGQPYSEACLGSTAITPTSILFGVGLGGAGLALNGAFPEHELALPNAIVQNEPISLLLELGLVGVSLVFFSLLLAFFAPLFSRHFLDGRRTEPQDAAKQKSIKAHLRQSVFWSHPALPLLISLIIAYLVTLNFFSGLPNALQIYLMPPLLFLIFAKDPHRLIDE